MDACPDCGNEYDRVGTHLSASSCSYPDLSSYQIDVLTGLLLGDGDVERRGTDKPKFRVRSTQRDFLSHIYNIMEPHSCSITLNSTSEYAAKQYGGDLEDYNDSYQFRTISSPVFKHFANWYDGSKKEIPNSIEIDQNILKYWYVCDGSLSGGSVRIYTSDMTDSIDRIIDLIVDDFNFRSSVFDRPNGKRESYIYLPSEETSKFLAKTEPLAGYEYKWETESFK